MRAFCTYFVFVSCCVFQIFAQDVAHLRSHNPPDYIFGPGDQLVIHISDVDELPSTPLRIDPSGYIDLPLAGRIEVAGMSAGQLKDLLEQRYRRYLTTPEVSVNLADSSSQPVSVIGEVTNPGVQQLFGYKRLLDVLSMAGGLKPDAGTNVIVTRDPRWGKLAASHVVTDDKGFSTATFALDKLLAGTSPEDNIPIEPHDVISVPKGEHVFVLGEVHKPGGFILSAHPTMSLLQALSLAEGLAPDSSPNNARILRPFPGGDGGLRNIHVDVSRIVAGKDPDVQLLANDVLFIPHSGMKVASRRAVEAALGITTGLLIYRY